MSWKMCFKETGEEGNLPFLIFAGVRLGVGQTRAPGPAVLSTSSVTTPLCASASSFVLCR